MARQKEAELEKAQAASALEQGRLAIEVGDPGLRAGDSADHCRRGMEICRTSNAIWIRR